MTNNSLFSYILTDLTGRKGQAVLFKSQSPDDVSIDFEFYLKSINNKDWNRGGTNLFIKKDSNDCIFFGYAFDLESGPFKKPLENHPKIKLDWTKWNTIIVTL